MKVTLMPGQLWRAGKPMDTIHDKDCPVLRRAVKKVPWDWANDKSLHEIAATGLKLCKVCNPVGSHG